MPSGREILVEFIEKYKELECLWKVNDKDYKNKHKRFNAMAQLMQILKKTDKNANMDTVTKKINSIRSSFNKEHNKVKASYRSGAGTVDVHVPKLWYYDLLLFLPDRDTEQKDSHGIDADIETTIDNQDIKPYTEMEQGSEIGGEMEYSQTSVSVQNTQNITNKSKRKMNDAATEVLAKISCRLDSSVSIPKPAFTAFGEHVAEKLRTMDKDAAKYCQKIINDAIFYAEFNNLNYTSRIVTDHMQHYPSPSTQVSSPYQSPHQKLERPSPSPSPQNQTP